MKVVVVAALAALLAACSTYETLGSGPEVWIEQEYKDSGSWVWYCKVSEGGTPICKEAQFRR